MPAEQDEGKLSRRAFLSKSLRWLSVGVLGGGAGLAATRSLRGDTVWQIDPDICVQCGNCSKECVLTPSAVKCVHAYEVCGYCDLCSAYLRPAAPARDTAAENRLCPVRAIKRTYIENPYYEYTIDESLCIACGKCVKACAAFGNGSLFLQVRHDRCLNCNQCSIARNCPSGAFKRVPAHTPYLLKGKWREVQEESG
ncbi:MAG: 4Fe-4S binding protein [Spirochaetaceae bacterium]|nr:MAG: 4Fe-4S binding protein [Spirochaetaceae bacterium]